MRIWVVVLAAFAGLASAADRNEFDAILESRYWDHKCFHFKDAAYGMARDVKEPGDAVAVVDRAISEKRYPAVHDRDLLLISSLLIETAGVKTPEEIRRIVDQSKICTTK